LDAGFDVMQDNDCNSGFKAGSDFLPAPEGAGLPDSSNTFGFIHRLEFDTVRAYCVVA
jgi:hypothetical protein